MTIRIHHKRFQAYGVPGYNQRNSLLLRFGDIRMLLALQEISHKQFQVLYTNLK